MPVAPAGPDDLARLEARIEAWAAGEREANALVAAIERDPDQARWYVRTHGEQKSIITVWLTLRERTLHYETYVLPAPEENREQVFEYLLRANARLYGMRFAIGVEDAIFLVGQMPLHAVDEEELDRIVGSSWAYAEQHFDTMLKLGFASRFGG